MNPQLVQRIRDCAALPTLPAIALQVVDLVQQEDTDVTKIAKVISSDPALAGRILKTVNSSFYARTQPVSTLNQALVILGLQTVKTLVLGFSLVSSLPKPKAKKAGGGSGGFDAMRYWKRSVYAATAARTIAAKVGGDRSSGGSPAHAEECFLAALLMDIGMLVFDRVLGEEYAAILEKAPTHAALPQMEAQALQMDHADVAEMLAQEWKLPAVLATPMARHHHPDSVREGPLRRLTQIAHLAGRCADVFADDPAAAAIKDVRDACRDQYKMLETDVDLLLGEIGRRTAEVAPLFEVAVGADTYESILAKAHEQLIERSLVTHREAATLQQKAATLQEQNAKLRARATIDPLTGLSNRGTFDEALAARLAACVANKRPLSLLLLDVDHFKQVNDTHGHPTGDAVLKALGQLLAGHVRPGMIAARFGGEEFALILPDLPRSRAAALAEIIRAAVHRNKAPLPFTVSIGVACAEPGGQLRAPAHLIKAADLAVYAAKHAGRNCVRVFSLSKATAAPRSA